MYHHPWTTILLVRFIVQALGSKNQDSSWACPSCSLKSFSGMWGDPPPTDLVHASDMTHKNNVIAYPYMYHWPWTTSQLMRYIFRALFSENQGHSWACPGWSWRPNYGMWGDSSLSDVVHASCNTNKIVGYHIHTFIIILGPLYHWWGAWSKLLAIDNHGNSWAW